LVFVAAAFIIFARISYQRAMNHELRYFTEINFVEELAQRCDGDPKFKAETERMDQGRYIDLLRSLIPCTLIKDMPQLRSWDYEAQLALHEDGTAQYPLQQF
jgi:hypothetical protein